MDRLAHGVVAAERERHVGDAAGDVAVRETFLQFARGVDEIQRVVVVFFDASGDGEDVRIEDDVFGQEIEFLRQQLIGARTDRHQIGKATRRERVCQYV